MDEAWRRLTAALAAAGLWQPLPGESVRLDLAVGRVTAAPVWARLSAPHYHAAAMDGYAVRARDTITATDTQPLHLKLRAASESGAQSIVTGAAGERQAQYVDTGDPLPAWADAVIPVENIQPIEAAAIEIRAAVTPWNHVRPMGEDMVATELVLPANHTLRPVDLGALAGSGHGEVLVRRRPRVAIIPTGTELVPAGSPVKPGDIVEYNSLVLAAQVEQWGGVAQRWPIVPDDEARIRAAVLEAARDHDLVLLNAGSSAGSEDYSARVVASVGKLLVHGVAVRPGHPVIAGVITPDTSGTPRYPVSAGLSSEVFTEPVLARTFGHTATPRPVPIIGVPGYPVSAALTGEIFVEPVLSRWLGRPPHDPPSLEAVITRKILSPLGDDEYVRVTVGRVGDRVVATPLVRGAGVISSLVRADGLVIIPRHQEGLNAGDRVTVRLYRPAAEIDRTLVHIGSHDLTLDLLAQYLAEVGLSAAAGSATRLSSANVGSQGGLVALRRGEAHLAGSHLLDPDTGEYNVSYIQRYLPDTPVVLVQLVQREQGLIVPIGNPRRLRTLADLGQPDLTFVNRQRGAGTRVLLDFEIGKIGLASADIRGYEREEYTHLAVAAAVASGVADCGLGIAAAARALNLDFVPLFRERYDLVIPRVYYDSALLRPLLDLLHTARFRTEVAALPGYDVAGMGTIAATID